MIHSRAFLQRVFLLAVAMVIGGCGEDERRVWRFALEEVEGSVQYQYAQEFKRRIEARSKGEIEVLVYPYGQLGTSSDLTELVQLGAVEFSFASPGHLGSMIPEVQLFSLHFVFSDDERINQDILAGNERLYALLQEAYSGKNLHLLALVQEGWMAWTADKPLHRPQDFAGLKIRIMNSPLLIRAYQLYGASPAVMAYSEVYSGLQLNMIDAQVNPLFAIEEMSFYEVQSHLVMGRHLPFIATVVANPQFMEKLSPAERVMVDEVKRELDEYIFEAQRDLNRERLEIIRSRSSIEISELTEDERDAFREASLPLRENYVRIAGKRGEALLETLLDAVKAAEAGAAAARSASEAY